MGFETVDCTMTQLFQLIIGNNWNEPMHSLMSVVGDESALYVLSCNLAILLSCYLATLLPCYLAILLPCGLLPCSRATGYLATLLPYGLLPCYLVTLRPATV